MLYGIVKYVLVAKKISATMPSVETPAILMHPAVTSF